MNMWDEKKIRIIDIADELGVSTATVSNVIHGKTKKISDATVRRVQEKLVERGYIPNMAATLLSQNNSRIVGVVVNNHPKYEGHVLEDPYISSAVNALSIRILRIKSDLIHEYVILYCNIRKSPVSNQYGLPRGFS